MSQFTDEQQAIINQAKTILAAAYRRCDLQATAPHQVKTFCQLAIGHLEHEAFAVLFLDNQHRLIECKQLFRGTIGAAAVYPREVIKEALALNAAAVILSHNHPSGSAEPSEADRTITERLVKALALVDIRVLDHVVVSLTETISFAERGLL